MAAIVEDDEHAHQERGGQPTEPQRQPGVAPQGRERHQDAQSDVRNEGLQDLRQRPGAVGPPEWLDQRIQLGSRCHTPTLPLGGHPSVHLCTGPTHWGLPPHLCHATSRVSAFARAARRAGTRRAAPAGSRRAGRVQRNPPSRRPVRSPGMALPASDPGLNVDGGPTTPFRRDRGRPRGALIRGAFGSYNAICHLRLTPPWLVKSKPCQTRLRARRVPQEREAKCLVPSACPS